MYKVLKNVSHGLVALSLAATVANAGPADRVQHKTDKEVLDSIETAINGLEKKFESTRVHGGSAPIEFQGIVQMITDFYRYNDLPERSILYLDRQSLQIGGGDNSVFQINMIAKPGRNTKLWANFGVKASYNGLTTTNITDSTLKDFEQSYHFADKGIGVKESLEAGIALRTKIASFMLKGGAMNWEEASPLSLWHGQPRMFAWRYLPYEIEQPIKRFYKMNIADGERVGRSAWNKKPFQGLVFKSEKIPGDIDYFMVYGIGNPTNKYERNYLDGAVDLDYAADEGSPYIAQGYGDSYTKQWFQRLSKKFKLGKDDMTIGINHGATMISDDIMAVEIYEDKEESYIQFNQAFQLGRLNSEYDVFNSDSTFVQTIKYDSKNNAALLDSLANNDTTKFLELKNFGSGYWTEPNVLSLDLKGKIKGNLSYHFDLGVSWVDTHKVDLTPESYRGTSVVPASQTFEEWKAFQSKLLVHPIYIGKVQKMAGTYSKKEIVKSKPSIATYLDLEYAPTDSTFKLEFDGILATKGYHAPFSFVAAHDAYYAFGSNMSGPGAFINNTEASPYSQNSVGGNIAFSPIFKKNYGHFKFKYGYNTQLSEERDILYFPYRLNGAELNASLLHSYSRYGAGEMPHPIEEDEYSEELGEKSLYYQARLGDESYAGPHIEDGSPTSGGLRGDYMNSFEGFVAYSNPIDVILNKVSKSEDISKDRDLSSIWRHNDDEKYKPDFYDLRGLITNIRVVDGDTTFYSMVVDSTNRTRDSIYVRNSDSTVIDSFDVETVSESGFVPMSKKNSFNIVLDWGMDISKLFNYKNDLFLSLYYEMSGVTKSGFAPFAFDKDKEDVLLLSHYIRSEPAIALTDEFYLLGLFGLEKWISGKTWVGEMVTDSEGIEYLEGIKRVDIESTDFAAGFGFDWDMMKRVSLHGRYKRFKHTDKGAGVNDYVGNHVRLELKAFF